jgi:iron complex outermembrane receptor protein
MKHSAMQWVSGLAACSVLLAAGAQADVSSSDQKSGPVGLEEIVVTATKRAESLKDVPVAITAITAEDIQVRGYTNYADYLNSVPNVWMQDLGPGSTQLYIRGLVAQGGSGFPVATYFGEAVTSVVTNNGGFANLRLIDVDRVEVLRGPQGTLFGANSLAGVIRVVPTAPNLTDLQVNADLRGWSTAHSDNLSGHAEGVLNLPIVNDKLAVRLVAYKDNIAGYIDNVVPAAAPLDYSAGLGLPPGFLVLPGHDAFTRKDINSQDVWGARAAITFKPSDALSFDLNYAQQDSRMNSEPPVQQSVGKYEVSRALDLYQPGSIAENEQLGSFVIKYDWTGAELTSASSYTQMKRHYDQDIAWLAENNNLGPQLWALDDSSKAGAFTQEIRLQSRGNAPFQWLLGYFYSDAYTDLAQYVPDYSCPACLPTYLPPGNVNYALVTTGSALGSKQKQNSLFAELSYDFNPHWTAGVGGRYLKDYVEAFSPSASGFLVGGAAAAVPPVGGENSIFNPSGYVRFKPTQDLTLYAQAAKGFRSGQTNQPESYTGSCTQTAQELGIQALSNPDKLWTYELGLKSAWLDNRVTTNIAIFHQVWDGVQLATSQPCGFQAVINGGNASGNGAELEMTARFTQSLHGNLSASWVHNKFDSVAPGTGFAEGDRVPGAPEENASAGLQYDFKLSNTWKGFARGDYVYVGAVHYVYGSGAREILQGGYGQANVRLAFQRDTLSVELFGNNVTDKYAAESTGDPASGGYVYLLRPREVGLELRYAFDRPR